MEKNVKFLLDAEITDDQADSGLQKRSVRCAYAYMACGSGGGGGRYTEETADKETSSFSMT